MLLKHLQDRLNKRSALDQTRRRHCIDTSTKSSNRIIDFSNNDYLGLKDHPKLAQSSYRCAQRFGSGSGSSPLISGYTSLHHAVEQQFSDWFGTRRTLLFNSGYCANLGCISALATRQHIILADKLCHASILDGIQLSRAKHKRYQHNNTDHLEALCQRQKPDIIATESIFSMKGHISPIQKIQSIARTHQACLYIDDAHGIGVLGNNGRGITDLLSQKPSDFFCLTLPLGKAFGTSGCMVIAHDTIIESILQFAKTYCYTTAPPPSACGAIQASLNLVQNEPWRRDKLNQNISNFIYLAKKAGLPLINSDHTPIQPILIGNEHQVLALQHRLSQKCIRVAAIRPPTVPTNQSCLRISLSCSHTANQIKALVEQLAYEVTL